MQRASLDAIKDLNEEHLAKTGDVEIASRISAYELGFRMQAAAPELPDFSKESPETLEMYGINQDPTKQFGTNCLLARRMVERGVRFVMMNHASWDDHTDLTRKLKRNCDAADKPTAALIKDLKQRGLLANTLVVWAGQFGRTPMCEIRNPRDANNAGRAHYPLAQRLFLAGGGIRGARDMGKTDDLCVNIVGDKAHAHDPQANMAHPRALEHA